MCTSSNNRHSLFQCDPQLKLYRDLVNHTMGKSTRKGAYVVTKGRIPGIYYTWEDCSAQVTGFPKNSFQGYDIRSLAEQAWEQHQNQLPKRQFLSEINPSKVINTDYPRSAKRARIAAMQEVAEKDIKPNRAVIVISDDEEEERKPIQKKHRVTAKILKKEGGCIDLVEEAKDQKLVRANSMVTDKILEKQANFIRLDEEESEEESEEEKPTPKTIAKEEKPLILTDAQNHVVKLAIAGHNIFLTGAAGSGKTATLKEILRLLRKKHHDQDEDMHPAIQIVAPTGIAALPLNGKTTYSFAGW